ncbi:GT_2_WfgS_like [Proteiniphilum saccharofermentans]|uniref:GT_2_WfgS_like n=1 Tax=Proteiniphilum saccharofermentans TaxID=1642647 RepID=A0A1R3T7T7_9BACT|nr:DUF5672 family protein [Proteiniphilum saccharofermentans]SCD21348.1 GT_2_WfgS_like [Proteiniphilum saccharofermentans]SDZ79704.1 Glycosyltransferase involved in cell wall bisynthesis [Porphyromonadaceae bacterium KH3R12]SFS85525.1 Glycosyltransferase involved in cell wall bisynthesis [Porphyromonadaceae bacterium NLAE-zl-C104]
MTQGIDKVFVMPENFVIDESFSGFADIPVERFPDYFFTSISGYNRLMLDVDFYRRFSGYKYMLIHQTDAFLFKPDLQYWCSKNYDYIGAPWLAPRKIKKAELYAFVLAVCPWIYSDSKRRSVKLYNNIGNGGLSLRKIGTFIKILESAKVQMILNTYLEKQVSGTLYNEDIFWSFEGRRLYKKFNKPDWREAMYFSTELHPSFAYNLMHKQLPFGCHAPFVYEPEFWKDHIPFVQIRMKRQPFISIICVVYNASSCISGCIDSIIEQRCVNDIELIIIDGNSTDGTQDILEKYGDRITFWKSEPDKGIYDAMNKALDHVRGKWIYFIGADDRLLPDFSSFVENELKDQHKIYYANVLWKGIKSRGFVSDYEQAKGGIFHQAIIYPASVFKKYRYNTEYKVSADYALNMQLHRDKSYEFEYRDYIIAYFNDTGVSSYGEDKAFLRDKRKLIMENFGIVVRFRYNFRIIKHKLRKK